MYANQAPYTDQEILYLFLSARIEFLHQLKQARNAISEIVATTPELLNYPLGTGYGNIQTILAAAKIAVPMTSSIAVMVSWNYLDGLAAIIGGINLILDEENYRQTQNKVKGVLGILSGVQAFAFSYNPLLTQAFQPIATLGGLGAASLAGPAFAFMTLCDLVIASIDFYNASKELQFEGWLEEKVKEINHQDQRLVKLNKKLKAIEKDLEEHEAKMTVLHDDKKQKTLQKKSKNLQNKIETLKNEIKTLAKEREELINDIGARSRVYCETIDYANKKYANFSEANFHRQEFIADKLSVIKNATTRKSISVSSATEDDRRRDKKIQNTLNENYKEKRINLVMKGLSFVGVTLLAIAPFTGPAAIPLLVTGLVISTFVASYYIYKHRQKIADFGAKIKNKISSLPKNSFFKSKPKDTELADNRYYKKFQPKH